MTLNEYGSIVQRHDYLPFGEEIDASIAGRSGNGYGPPQSDKVRQQFTGYERDVDTGLDFAQARYYANVQGRFTSPDPEHMSAKPYDPQSWNAYAYVQNSPGNRIDPDGLDYKICYNSQSCWTTTDDGFADYTKSLPEGFSAAGGAVFDEEGNRIATYSYFEPADVAAIRRLAAGMKDVFDVWQAPIEILAPSPGPGGPIIKGITKGSKILQGSSKGLKVVSVAGKTVSFALPPGWKNWAPYLLKRGWTETQIGEAIATGVRKAHAGDNFLNPGNSMSLITHPSTGQSLIIDNVTQEVIQLGGKGFLF